MVYYEGDLHSGSSKGPRGWRHFHQKVAGTGLVSGSQGLGISVSVYVGLEGPFQEECGPLDT